MLRFKNHFDRRHLIKDLFSPQSRSFDNIFGCVNEGIKIISSLTPYVDSAIRGDVKVLPRLELGSLDSKAEVLTITP